MFMRAISWTTSYILFPYLRTPINWVIYVSVIKLDQPLTLGTRVVYRLPILGISCLDGVEIKGLVTDPGEQRQLSQGRGFDR